MIGQHYLEDVLTQLRKLKSQADKAIAQVSDAQLLATIDPEANSIAILMKHMAGNMRSRWTDFLTSDGEKPDRDRDREFEAEAADSRAAVVTRWEQGWRVTLDTIGALTPADLEKTIRLRGEVYTVLEAINRQLTHYAAHVGQIVLLAKHLTGPAWQTLSIPRGQSKTFDVAKSGVLYRLEKPGEPHRR
ncbi:MAG TPA: DUF1572 family protein [Vicinamibacterales bacterium]|nr:DUF1572 family protein [Vicinamibacterales bacterium]